MLDVLEKLAEQDYMLNHFATQCFKIYDSNGDGKVRNEYTMVTNWVQD